MPSGSTAFAPVLPDSSTLELSTSNFLAKETSSMPQPRPRWSSSCLLEYWHEDWESPISAIKVTTTFSWSKQSKWFGQLGDQRIKVIRASWWSGWTRRRRVSSCASLPPAPTFQSLKTFAKNFFFPQSLRLVGTTITRALKPAATAAMTPGTTSLRTVIPRMSCYIRFIFFCVVMLHVCVLQLYSSFCMFSSMHRLKKITCFSFWFWLITY